MLTEFQEENRTGAYLPYSFQTQLGPLAVPIVLVRVFSVINSVTKSSLGRTGFFYLTDYRPSSREAKAGTWRQEPKQSPWRNSDYRLLLLAHPVCFLIHPRIT